MIKKHQEGGIFPKWDCVSNYTGTMVGYHAASLVDVYKRQTYTEPQRVNDMVKSFIAFYEQNGRLPVWNFWGSETDKMCIRDSLVPDEEHPFLLRLNG